MAHDLIANLEALLWHMSRFTGYAGVVNYMGSRFLAMPKAIKPMLGELKQRGLLFLEDGSMALSARDTSSVPRCRQRSRAAE